MQSITLQVGANSIKIDQTGITLTGTLIKGSATGMMQLSAGATMTHSAPLVKIN
jgi:type VI secretion system secreted protein VgrG